MKNEMNQSIINYDQNTDHRQELGLVAKQVYTSISTDIRTDFQQPGQYMRTHVQVVSIHEKNSPTISI